VDEHRELVTLLRSKNPAELARTATEHVTSAGRILVQQLNSGDHE
jgi:DNA-binding GntR family transcriptional regulator